MSTDDYGTVERYESEDVTCGIGLFRPKWLQKLAKPEFFLINFSLVAIFQGATFTYIVGSLSTLEKRYSFDSKISGFILIADNVSQMLVSPLIGYLANRYNRPRIMAMGEIIVAFACFLLALPYFIYGPALHLLPATLSNNSHKQHQYQMCAETNDACNGNSSATVWSAVFIIWFASFCTGIGYTAFYTIGIPYLDDNTSKKNSPMYLSASAALRLCGPSLGFLLSSLCLSYYEDPKYDPGIAQNDPRWIGAWWMGYVILGVCIIIFSIPLSMFPKQMMTQKLASSMTRDKLKETSTAFVALKRLLTNPIFMFHMFGLSLRLIGYLGYYVYKPKYIESQFHKSASDANFWTGFTSVPTMAIGIFAGGFVLSKFRPKPRSVAFYVFAVEILFTFAMLAAMTLKCPVRQFPHTQLVDGRLRIDSNCNTDCRCTTDIFQPICGNDNTSNYFSPCYAGCKSVQRNDKNIDIFSECLCNYENFDGNLNNGYCKSECNQFTQYIALFAIAGVISSTAKIGDSLITLRCVEPRDKSFAMGIVGSFFAIFAYIPYPLIFGAISDNSCMVWRESCGKTGNCWLYNTIDFNYNLHIGAFCFMLTGSLLHLFVVFYANRIKNMFNDDDDEQIELGSFNNDLINTNDHSELITSKN